MEIKKYIDIERLKDKYASAFTQGEHIVCQEKLDGSNASLRYDATTGRLVAFSRRRELDEMNTLNGFYTFMLTCDPVKWQAITDNGRYIVFGEWLIHHTITYPDDMMRRFYVFDVWDTVNERYMSWFFTKWVAEELGLLTVPVFYEGKFTSWEDIHKLVGQTQMGAMPCGEGVVVKSQDRLDNKSSRTPSYVKLVAADFSEIHQSKPHEVDPEKLAARAAAEEIVSTIVNKRRVQKQLEILVDDNIIPADWDEKNMAVIAKNISRMVYNDCMKEEPEIVKSVEDFGKICAKLTMGIVRGFLSER